MLVLAVGTFTLLGYNGDRFARDLATFTGLSAAILFGITISYYGFKVKRIIIIILAIILLGSNFPIENWLGDYTALRLCDRQAINYLNAVTDGHVKVKASSTVATWIYQLYSNNSISYERIFEIDDIKEVQYFIFRNNSMTYGSETRVPSDYSPLQIDSLENHGSLIFVAEFLSEGNIVRIYQVKQ